MILGWSEARRGQVPIQYVVRTALQSSACLPNHMFTIVYRELIANFRVLSLTASSVSHSATVPPLAELRKARCVERRQISVPSITTFRHRHPRKGSTSGIG
jgi:hypothetical protein